MNKSAFPLVALAVSTSLYAGTPVLINIVPTPSGGIYSEFPDGDDGTPAIPLVTTQPANISVFNGASWTLDLADYLEQPDPPTATFSPNCVGTFPTGNVSFSGSVFTGANTTSHNITCQPSAERDGVTVAWDSITFTSVEAPTSDTTPPNRVIGLTTTGGDGIVTVSGRCSTDPFDGEAGSLDRIVVLLDGAGAQNVTSCGAGLSPEYTLSDPDSRSPTHSLTDGRDFDFSFTGGASGTLGQAPVWSSPLTGTGFIGATFTSITNSADYATCTIGAGAGSNWNDGNSFGAGVRRIGTQLQVWLWSRTLGGSTVPIYSQNISALPYTVVVEETTPNLWTVYGGSTPNQLTPIGTAPSHSFSVGSAKNWGYGAAAGAGASGTIACEGENLTLNSAQTWSINYTTSVGGDFSAYSVDSDSNISTINGVVEGLPEDEPPSEPGEVDPALVHYQTRWDETQYPLDQDMDDAQLTPRYKMKFSRDEGGAWVVDEKCGSINDGVCRSLRLSLGAGIGACPPAGCSGSRRSEVQFSGTTLAGTSSNCFIGSWGGNLCTEAVGKVFFFTWREYLDTFTFLPNKSYVFFQIQQLGSNSSPCDDGHPHVSFYRSLSGESRRQLEWENRTPGVSPGGTCTDSNVLGNFSSTQGDAAINIPTSPVLDKWVSHCVRGYLSPDNDGEFAYWRRIDIETENWTKLYENFNPTRFEQFPATGAMIGADRLKLGIYGYDSGGLEAVGFFDDFHVSKLMTPAEAAGQTCETYQPHAIPVG